MQAAQTVDISKYQVEDALDLGAIVRDLDRVAELQQTQKRLGEISVAWLASGHPLMGGEYYRGLRPAALLNHRYGWHTAVCDRMGTTDDEEGPLSFVTPGEGGHVMTPRIIVLRPIKQWSSYWSTRAHKNGQLLIADLDDDVWGHEDWGPNHDTFRGKPTETDDDIDKWCWEVDGWLASTPVIKKRILEFGPGRWKKKPSIVVAPNCYDPTGVGGGMLPKPGRRLGTRLWLSGRMSGDLELWRELIAPLLTELDLTFVHVGQEVRNERVAGSGEPRSFVGSCGFPPHRTIARPTTVLPLMHKSFSDVSIGVIIQADHAYNAAKTEASAVELASMGLPLVAATNHPLYKKIPGRVEIDPQAVRDRIEALLDPEVWEIESKRARAWATETAVKREAEYLAAFETLIGQMSSPH